MLHLVATFLSSATSWLMFVSVKSVGLIALVVLVQWVCRAWLPAQGRYLMWFVVLVSLVAPIGIQWNVLSPSSLTPDIASYKKVDAVIPRFQAPAIFYSRSPEHRESPEFASSTSCYLVVWLSGMLLLASVTSRNVLRYRRVVARSTKLDPTIDALLEQCMQQIGVRRNVYLLESKQIQSPAIFGWRSPTLLLPCGLTNELTREQLRHVFLHELAHVKRFDLLVNWLIAMIQVVHWFNPAVWFAVRAIRFDMEKACDAKVIAHLPEHERTAYGETLIGFSDARPSSSFHVQWVGIFTNHLQLKGRIQMIANFKPSTRLRSMLSALLLVMICIVATVQPSKSADQVMPMQTVGHRAQSDATITKDSGVTTPPEAASANSASKNRLGGSAKLQTAYFKLEHIKAADALKFILPTSGLSLLSNRGSAVVDDRTNTLLTSDAVSNVAEIQKLIATLDVPLKQVLLDTRIAIVDEDFSRYLRTRTESLDPSIATLDANFDLDAELAKAEAERRIEIVSSPKLITVDRTAAAIEQGIAIPASADQGGAPSKTIVRVTMTPYITQDKHIRMDVQLAKQTDSTADSAAGIPPTTDKRQIAAQLFLVEGQTAVIGDAFSSPRNKSSPNGSGSPLDQKRLIIFLKSKITQS